MQGQKFILLDLIVAAPEICLAVCALVSLICGAFLKSERSFRFVSYFSILLLVLALLLVFITLDERALAFGDAFVADNFAVYLKTLIVVATITVVLISREYMVDHGIDHFEFPILLVLAVLGMFMMVSANDLISLYMGLELQSLSLYIIAAFQRDTMRSAEAGLKYFVLGALASGLLLYGLSLIYGFSGTTNFDDLSDLFSDGANVSPGIVIGIVFAIAGMAFKVSAVPFHMWTPDVYEGAPTPVTAFFAVAPKVAAMGLLIRLLTGPFGELGNHWQQIIIFISVASMLLGAFAAINQKNIKRLMAYSSIGHMGYALIGLAVAGQYDVAEARQNGIESMLVYLAIYLFMNVGTFACILLMKKNGRMVEGINELAGLSKTNPVVAVILTIFMFSMAGIPPLAGFLGKLYIFQSAVRAELFGLAIIGVLASVVGAFYYIRIVRYIYFEEPEEKFDGPIAIEIKSILAVTSLVILLFVLLPEPIIFGAKAASLALFPQ